MPRGRRGVDEGHVPEPGHGRHVPAAGARGGIDGGQTAGIGAATAERRRQVAAPVERDGSLAVLA